MINCYFKLYVKTSLTERVVVKKLIISLIYITLYHHLSLPVTPHFPGSTPAASFQPSLEVLVIHAAV